MRTDGITSISPYSFASASAFANASCSIYVERCDDGWYVVRVYSCGGEATRITSEPYEDERAAHVVAHVLARAHADALVVEREINELFEPPPQTTP